MSNGSGMPVLRLLILGLIFHLVYIGTVFDCYFTSPVVNGMRSYGLGGGQAKRLVLIVGDGLRADLLLSLNPFPSIPNSPEVVAPYLREVVETKGAFGISHTHVPTESRPGHVALIGGMYEDVSAVTKGWKTNPVDFDSVFNRSRHTYSFGSPDILPMFARGATPGKVETWCYHEDEEDFTKDATELDVWVLNQLRSLLHNASSDSTLNAELRGDKTVFFLHLLGLDTTGHSYRPHSKEYMKNIQVVDEIVRQVDTLFSEFYEDNDTSFIFTADHGMSKIGNHGDGDPDNTRTPFIAWGAGVRGPLPDSSPTSHDEYSAPFGLSHLLRHDVEQADVAALMAALIGVDWPVNSVGVLPDVDHTRPGYLNSPEGERSQARASLVNAKVILEHYRVKHEQKNMHTLFYKPYHYFSHHSHAPSHRDYTGPGQDRISEIEDLIENLHYNDARKASAELIKNTLEGLRYLQTYDRTLIRTIVTIAYLGWIAYGAVTILPLSQNDVGSFPQSPIAGITAIATILSFWSLFALQRSPLTFYVYIIFPVYFWYQVVSKAGNTILRQLRGLKEGQHGLSTLVKIVVRGTMVVAALQSMVAAYTHRSIWSIGFVIIGLLWPLSSWPREVQLKNGGTLLVSWTLSCLSTAVFPLLDVNKHESVPTILAGGICMLAVGIIGAMKLSVSSSRRKFQLAIGIQCVLLFTSMLVTASSAASLQQKLGLPLMNQVAGWAVLVAASAFPFTFYTPHTPLAKILTFFLGFSVCFIILSISVEGLFYSAYSFTLFLWMEVEDTVRSHSRAQSNTDQHAKNENSVGEYNLRADDLRVAVFFLFFVQVAFFGTGNVASISSFYLEPVYRLVPIFNPFLMAALLIFKIVAPYIILSAFFATLNARLHLPPFSLFLVALTLTDVMTMTFFFNVTDTGSWLEIGQSISFFCISSLLLVWSAGICAIGEVLMAGTLTVSTQDNTRIKQE